MDKRHTPVLLHEVMTVADPKAGEIYCDLTAGFGGHAAAILERIGRTGEGWLIDQDSTAIEALETRFDNDQRIRIRHDNFGTIDWQTLPLLDIILIDLGVSSAQLDTADRGFSFRHNG
ncbi:MAG: 16S rRNA (cytosine(1402)-N(4))-methyltransferase, partial [Candidatus Saccharibacteria bacterium]